MFVRRNLKLVKVALIPNDVCLCLPISLSPFNNGHLISVLIRKGQEITCLDTHTKTHHKYMDYSTTGVDGLFGKGQKASVQ